MFAISASSYCGRSLRNGKRKTRGVRAGDWTSHVLKDESTFLAELACGASVTAGDPQPTTRTPLTRVLPHRGTVIAENSGGPSASDVTCRCRPGPVLEALRRLPVRRKSDPFPKAVSRACAHGKKSSASLFTGSPGELRRKETLEGLQTFRTCRGGAPVGSNAFRRPGSGEPTDLVRRTSLSGGRN